jgi:hypothetical protein
VLSGVNRTRCNDHLRGSLITFAHGWLTLSYARALHFFIAFLIRTFSPRTSTRALHTNTHQVLWLVFVHNVDAVWNLQFHSSKGLYTAKGLERWGYGAGHNSGSIHRRCVCAAMTAYKAYRYLAVFIYHNALNILYTHLSII